MKGTGKRSATEAASARDDGGSKDVGVGVCCMIEAQEKPNLTTCVENGVMGCSGKRGGGGHQGCQQWRGEERWSSRGEGWKFH